MMPVAQNVQAAYVRDLRGVIERERAEMGVLITLEEPSKPMRKEATEAGLYKSPAYEKGFDRIQILTIEQLLAGEGIEYPRLADVTFKKAPKVKGAVAEQLGLEV